MKNLTLSVEDGLLDQVRVLAALKRTSVNQMVRDFFRKSIEEARAGDEAREELLRLIDEASITEARTGWSRSDVYSGEQRFDRWN